MVRHLSHGGRQRGPSEIFRQYGFRGVPAFVVIDPSGEIRSISLGYTSEIGLRLRLWWASRIAA